MRWYAKTLVSVSAVVGISMLPAAVVLADYGQSKQAGNEVRPHAANIGQYRYHNYPDFSEYTAEAPSLTELLEEHPTAAGPDEAKAMEESGQYYNYPAYKPNGAPSEVPAIGPDWTPSDERSFRPKGR